MTTEAEVLQLLVVRLNLLGLPYMLSGSMALNFYTTPRMTRDIDVVVELRETDIERLVQAFQIDFYVDDEMIRTAMEQDLPFNIIHLASVTKVDLIPRKKTPFQENTFLRRRFLRFGNEDIAIISPEDLILSKLLWAKDSLSEVQLRDVKTLLENCAGLDRAYINTWVRQLSLEKPFSRVKE